MVIRNRQIRVLAAMLLGGMTALGCQSVEHPLTAPRNVCNCDNCRRARGEIPTAAPSEGLPLAPGATGNGGGVVPRATPAASGPRVPFPQSPNIIDVREPTLFERVKFGLKRLNPLSGDDDIPVLQFLPRDRHPGPTRAMPADGGSPGNGGNADVDPAISAKFAPARIAGSEIPRISRTEATAAIEQWPHAPKDQQTAAREPNPVSGFRAAVSGSPDDGRARPAEPRMLTPAGQSNRVGGTIVIRNFR